ncbi:MAG: polyribonucleotide nucleotidyltransferase [Myxococcota bacterium]
MFVRESVELGGRELTIETGRMAKQADGAVIVRLGDTMVLVTAVAAHKPREVDFLPLTCDYLEKTFAAGKIPGGYFKREGRLTEIETLTSRLIDRPCRPLFPNGWRYETQLIALVISFDRENPGDVLAITGASTALMISDIPWEGPIAGVRVGRVDGAFVLNPTLKQQDESDLNLVVVASKDALVMVEGGAKGVPESVLVDALFFAHEQAQPILELQERLRAAVGKPKRPFIPREKDSALVSRVAALGADRIRSAYAVSAKQERQAAIGKATDEVAAELAADFPERDKEIKEALHDLEKKHVREMILAEGRRIDGRKPEDIRNITCEVAVLPRTHGTGLFTRGETQALVVTTLGTDSDVQRIEALAGDVTKRFLMHYNFPPFSTGETKFLRGPSRREIGHGALAERALAAVLPSYEEFPYTIRIVSEVLESNGSSSMATVCGGALSMMDAGVPIKQPVAGVAMGLIKEGDRVAVLTDILGDEDHLGDMDFKVAGTRDGVTALQMDIKVQGLSRAILERALTQARDARLFVLSKMSEALAEPRKELSPYAPRIFTMQIKPDRIRDIIGPGGKTIRALQDQTGVEINVEDDGTISIAAVDEAGAKKAMDMIRGLTAEPEVGQCYVGLVRSIREFGAFVEILPGLDGLLHISELDTKRVRVVEDVVKVGDEVIVKVVNVDRDGKIRLSRKDAFGVPAEQALNMR